MYRCYRRCSRSAVALAFARASRPDAPKRMRKCIRRRRRRRRSAGRVTRRGSLRTSGRRGEAGPRARITPVPGTAARATGYDTRWRAGGRAERASSSCETEFVGAAAAAAHTLIRCLRSVQRLPNAWNVFLHVRFVIIITFFFLHSAVSRIFLSSLFHRDRLPIHSLLYGSRSVFRRS